MSKNSPLALVFNALFITFMLAPLVIVCLVAFTPNGYISLPWDGFSLRWFRAILDNPHFIDAFYLSVMLGTASATVANTTVETTITASGIGSLTIPANLLVVGDSFTAKMGGSMTTQGSGQQIIFRVVSGATTIIDTGPIILGNIGATPAAWELELDFFVRTIGAATVATIVTNGNFLHGTNNYPDNFNSVNSTTFDTTIVNNLDITVQWASTGANNSITSEFFTLFKVF